MINIAEIVNDPDFAQAFTILRSTGSWVNGTWTPATSSLPAFGVVEPASSKDLKMVPEGDINSEPMSFYSSAPIYTTRNEGTPAASDILVWRSQNFRVLNVFEYEDFGYYHAIAVRMSPV